VASTNPKTSIHQGQKIALSPPRRVTVDMLTLAREIPTIPVQKLMDLKPLVAARASLTPRPSWPALFIRALALTACRHPALRQVYVPGWRPCLYESPYSVAMVAIERHYEGQPVVFTAKIRRPEDLSAREIDDKIRHYKEAPLKDIGLFARTILLGKLPGPLRRFILRRRLFCSGKKRVERSGTFGISVYSSLGVESLHPIAPVTSLLNYGVIDRAGEVNVRLIYDHRVTDGSVIARAMNDLEVTLRTRLVEELSTGAQDHIAA
jgi:hypothetical protein